jgi:hypothetical protein
MAEPLTFYCPVFLTIAQSFVNKPDSNGSPRFFFGAKVYSGADFAIKY